MDYKGWGKLFSLARSQSVLGLVANGVLSDATLSNRIPAELKTRLKNFVMANLTTHSMLDNTLIHVVTLLEEAGVRSVLLKGQGLARYYPMPRLRQCGDIDLYVDEKDYLKAYNLICPIATRIDDVTALTEGKHFHVTIGKVVIEIHRFAELHSSSTLNDVFQEYASEGLHNDLVVFEFSGVKVMTPADNFNAFYIFNHLWYHFITEGVGLRQLCDWMMFLHSRCSVLDLDYLKVLLERMGLMMPWKVFGCVLVNYLGMPEHEFPFYDGKYLSKSHSLMSRILSEGNFGRESK